MASKKVATGDKTYILELKDGNIRKITIPASWKVTFGQLVPHTLRDTNGRTSQIALRIYEGSKENLRAVMTDVVAIRDSEIKIMERRTEVQREVMQKATGEGHKDVVVEARVTEWVDPDADEANAKGSRQNNQFLKQISKPDF